MATRIKREPKDYASALLEHFGLTRVGNIYSFASRIGLKVKEVDSDDWEGALLRTPNKLKGIVAVKRSIRETGRKNFTIAHEIGHFILPGHGTSECFCTAVDINSWQTHIAQTHELAANQFASELLLPTRQINEILQKKSLTLSLIIDLSIQFDTSLTATAIKCIEITNEPCALVWSVNRKVKWASRSENFSYFVTSDGQLGDDSIAGRLFQNHVEKHLEGEISIDVWANNSSDKDATIWEDSLYMPNYDAVLTILTIQ
ncbi:MAG: ImmA/IrrE family metallo-endopeptidase [Aridibacter sp.]